MEFQWISVEFAQISLEFVRVLSNFSLLRSITVEFQSSWGRDGSNFSREFEPKVTACDPKSIIRAVEVGLVEVIYG